MTTKTKTAAPGVVGRKAKPKPHMEKASGPFSTRVWHINAPKGMVIDEVLYGEGGTVVTIAYRVKGADE